MWPGCRSFLPLVVSLDFSHQTAAPFSPLRVIVYSPPQAIVGDKDLFRIWFCGFLPAAVKAVPVATDSSQSLSCRTPPHSSAKFNLPCHNLISSRPRDVLCSFAPNSLTDLFIHPLFGKRHPTPAIPFNEFPWKLYVDLVCLPGQHLPGAIIIVSPSSILSLEFGRHGNSTPGYFGANTNSGRGMICTVDGWKVVV